MGLLKNNRASISFSEIGDAELLAELEEVNYNLSGYCKDLMKDGQKYRAMMEQQQPFMPKAQAQPARKTYVPRKPVPSSAPAEQSEEEKKKLVSEKLNKMNF